MTQNAQTPQLTMAQKLRITYAARTISNFTKTPQKGIMQMSHSIKKYMPLILAEGYLLTTLLIYIFGPVHFRTHNTFLFYILIFSYHLSFISGFIIADRTFRRRYSPQARPFNWKFFYVCLFFGLLSTLGSYKNIMLSPSWIPYGLFDEIIRGLIEPNQVYAERIVELSAGGSSGSRLFNILSLGFAFFKFLFIFVFIYYWRNLNYFQKTLSVLYSLFFISTGVASGTNSAIFIFFFFTVFSILTILYCRNSKYLTRVLTAISILFIIPVLFFGYIMSKRGGGFDYFSKTSPLGDISVSLATPEIDSFFGLFGYSAVWLNYYLTQGYYGFSLILDLDHIWKYGFGNSAFLQRQFGQITGIDVSGDTFQSRVSMYWDANAQWHSFYGQFANDVGRSGVVFLMFGLGFFLSRIWSSILLKNSFYGVSLIPIFALLIIFIPANNQVFGFIDTFSFFVVVSVLWFKEDKKIGFKL